MTSALTLAIDVGTGSVRAALVDANGRIVTIAAREHDQIVPRFGWAEQRPTAWWEGVVATIRGVLADVPDAKSRIAVVVACGQMHGTVLVDADDPAFQKANKAIGPALTAAEAEAHCTKDGWQVRDEGNGRFRRVVPSPAPRKIIELPAIERLVDAGQIVVCCGGGGIPVAVDSLGRVRGVAAVIVTLVWAAWFPELRRARTFDPPEEPPPEATVVAGGV